MKTHLRELIGCVLDKGIIKELQLPIKHLRKYKSMFGIGLRSTVPAAPGAFLPSMSLTRSPCEQLLYVLPNIALPFYNAAVRAHETWESQVPEEYVIPLTAIESPCLDRQKQLVHPAEVVVFDSLNKGNDRKKGFRASLVVIG